MGHESKAGIPGPDPFYDEPMVSMRVTIPQKYKDFARELSDDDNLSEGVREIFEFYLNHSDNDQQTRESPPAPKSNSVSKPNDRSDQTSSTAREDELSVTDRAKLEFWTEFAEYLDENNSVINSRKPAPEHYRYFAVGDSRAHLSARVNTQKEAIGVDLMLKERPEALFQLLRKNREKIEDEIGLELGWNKRPNKKWCVIRHWWEQENPLDKSNWSDEFRTLSDGLTWFYDAFAPRLSNLDADDWSAESPSESE